MSRENGFLCGVAIMSYRLALRVILVMEIAKCKHILSDTAQYCRCTAKHLGDMAAENEVMWLNH